MLNQAPKELLVFLISALPIGELRAGIPIGLGFQLDPKLVFTIAVLGNLAPVVPILLLLEPVSKWLMDHSKFFNRVLGRLFEKTRQKHSARLEKYGTVGLTIFVGIPAPITGAWSGALAAWLFGIEFRHAVPAIALGVLISGAIVMTGSSAAFALAKIIANPIVSWGLAGLIGILILLATRYPRGRN